MAIATDIENTVSPYLDTCICPKYWTSLKNTLYLAGEGWHQNRVNLCVALKSPKFLYINLI